MKVFTLLSIAFLTLPCLCLGQSEEKGKEKQKGMRHIEQSDVWSSLSPQEKEALREALRAVWSDPDVLSARESVNRSANEYQVAIREAIAQHAPESSQLLARITQASAHNANGSRKGLLPPPGGKGKGGPGKGGGTGGGLFKRGGNGMLGQMMTSPMLLEKMTPEQKEKFRKASESARQQGPVVDALAEIKALSKQEDETRKKRHEALKKFRKAYFQAVVEADPTLAELMPKTDR